MLQEMLKTSLFLILSTTFIRIISFRRRSLTETTYILTFAIQKILVLLKIIFLNLLDRNQTVFLTAAILRGFD